jgi:pimeloyl-ACP methyl ester carboxylesterase
MAPLLFLLAAGAVCTTATPECTERLPVGPDGKWALLYRSHALTQRNPQIEEAFVLVHGQGRNADGYFSTALAAGFLAGALDRAVIVSPRFASNDGAGCKDVLAEGEINQPCRGNTWRGGGAATNSKDASSFHVADELLKKLADRRTFPNLKRIVVAGHSAGGQFAHRYAAASRFLDTLGVPVKLVVSNPSSYLYLDARRPDADGKLGEFAGKEGCPNFNRYLYGMDQRSGYPADVADETLRANLLKRSVVYLLGELDTEPLAGFDSSCSAMAQGKNRWVRGENYWKSVRSEFGAKHELVKAPMCGHNARCVFTTDAAIQVVFGR